MTAKNVYEKIISILRLRLTPEKIILIGSRAKKRARPGSDIDIAIVQGEKLSHREERKLKEEIDRVAGLYSVDLVFVERVNDEFKRIIEQTGVVLYEKGRSCPCNTES